MILLTFSALISAEHSHAQEKSGWANTRDLVIPVAGPTPYRVFFLDDPMRLVVDIKGHDWTDVAQRPYRDNPAVQDARMGAFHAGWGRLVLDLATPIRLVSSTLSDLNTKSNLVLRFAPSSAEDFAAVAGPPPEQMQSRVLSAALPKNSAQLRIAIDPGHGGIDPGAIRDGVTEKSIALAFAREMAGLISEDPSLDAFLTRDTDMFVSLDDRVALARAAHADIFVSIHANTVEWGNAEGATIFTLSDTASDAASEALADFENRADLAAGLDISAPADDVASLLTDMARVETNARSRDMGDHLVRTLTGQIPIIRSKPHRSAGFRVLRAPDVPSVLLELGFMSNRNDRNRMTSRQWQKTAAAAIVESLKSWAKQDKSLSLWAARH